MKWRHEGRKDWPDFAFQGQLAECRDIFHCHKGGCSKYLVGGDEVCSSIPVVVFMAVEHDGIQHHHRNTSGCISEDVFGKNWREKTGEKDGEPIIPGTGRKKKASYAP